MGCTKISLNEKKDILNYIYSISNDVMINNLISDLINRDGVTNFFINDDGSYAFSLINEKHDRLYILFNDNHIFVGNNFDGIRQQINYQVDSDGKYVSINNFSSIESHDNCIDRSVKYERKYDCFDNLIYENKITETNDLNGESDCSIISKYFINDQWIRVNSISYDNNPSKNRIVYYVYNNDAWHIISEEEFNKIFKSENFQKIKLFA